LRVGELLLACNSGLARPVSPFQYSGPDVLEAHGCGFPLICSAHHERDIGSVLFQLLEQGVELVEAVRGSEAADLGEGFLVCR